MLRDLIDGPPFSEGHTNANKQKPISRLPISSTLQSRRASPTRDTAMPSSPVVPQKEEIHGITRSPTPDPVSGLKGTQSSKKAKEYGEKIELISNYIPEMVYHRDPNSLCSSTKTIRQFLGLPIDGPRLPRIIGFR